MKDMPEIYADSLTAFTVSTDGTIVKLFFSSARPNQAGKVTESPVVAIVMPANAATTMLNDIQNAVGQAKQRASHKPN